MALQKSNVDVSFEKGINQKKDSKQTLSSDLLKCENRVFTKQGALSKRKGYTAITTKDCDGNSITDLKSISKYRETQLVMVASNKLYSYSDSNNAWVSKDNFISASASLDTVVRNSAEQSNLDAATVNGMTVFVWNDSRGGTRYSIQDEISGSFLVSDEELIANGAGDSHRCIAANNNILVFYATGNDLEFKLIKAGDPCAAPTTGSTIRPDVHADHIMDFTTIGNSVYAFYKSSTAGEAQLAIINSNGVFQQEVTLTETVDDALSIYAYTNVAQSASFVSLIWKEDADTIKGKVHKQFLSEEVATTSIDATVGTDAEKITQARTNATTDGVTIFYHIPAAANSNDYIKTNTLTLAGAAGTASVFARSVGIATHAFNDTDGNLYIGTLHESTLQSTVFVLDSNADVIAKYSPGNAGEHGKLKSPVNTFVELDGSISFPVNTKGRILSENATLFSFLGISKANINFTSLNTYNNVSINQNLFVAGGILTNYDGQSIHEQGYNLYPEGVSNSATASTGGSMSDGTYQYVAVYEWTDNTGAIHRSAPSVAVSVTISGGTSTQTVDIDVPTIRLTKKKGTRSDVTVELYRTEDAGSIFYKVTSISSPVENDPTADSVTITDTLADGTITSNEILYATGGILDNIAAPSADIVVAHNNRLWLAGLDNKNRIRYSKAITPGVATGFNEALEINLEPTGGDITQMASMDSNLIIFKENNIYTIGGDPPNDIGENSTLTEPQLIATDTGCKDSNSIVLGPDGLYFKSAKGIYILSRSLESSYIGAQVEDFNDETITSAQLLENSNEVRFTTATGTLLVYNYYFKQWSIFTNKKIDDSVIWLNNYIYINTDDEILQESDGYLDNTTFVSSTVSTGWIPVSGLQGFQRLQRISILGDFKSAHLLKVTIYNDYSNTPVQESIFDTAAVLSSDSGFYGSGVYGAESPYGGSTNGVYQFQTHCTRQKCQAVRIQIEDVFDNDDLGNNTGEGMTLSGVTLHIGVKQGMNKTIAGKKG
jgi:hypothetical protein